MNGNELVGCHLVLYNKSEEIKFPYQMTFMSFNGNLTGVTCEAGTASHSGAPEFTPVFDGVRVAQSLVLCVMFCRSLFVLFLLAIVLSVILRLAACGIFKPFLVHKMRFWNNLY